jgi:hypothetical protein
MNKKLLVISLLIFSSLIFSGCSVKNVEIKSPSKNEVNVSDSKPKADKVQVFLFHTTQRCATCVAIGKFSVETVYEYFQPELRDGKIEAKEVNIDLPENKELAKKFQASGSALFINAIYNGQDNISEDTKVWRLTTNEAQFKSYLKDKINNLLGK